MTIHGKTRKENYTTHTIFIQDDGFQNTFEMRTSPGLWTRNTPTEHSPCRRWYIFSFSRTKTPQTHWFLYI